MPHLIVGKRRDEQYTVQASLATLREAIPPSHFTPLLAHITDGKAVGEAIRMVGADLVYVRFPINTSKHPISFTLPRAFLIPVTCRILARQASSEALSRQPSRDHLPAPVNVPGGASGNGNGTCTTPTSLTGGQSGFGSSAQPSSPAGGLGRSHSNASMTSPSPANMSLSLGATVGGGGGVAHNNKDCHDHVDLRLHLGAQGEPALCVVCGRWDEAPQGKKRKSGHKCKECIGKKSLDRLRSEFTRLMSTEENESDDEELASHA